WARQHSRANQGTSPRLLSDIPHFSGPSRILALPSPRLRCSPRFDKVRHSSRPHPCEPCCGLHGDKTMKRILLAVTFLMVVLQPFHSAPTAATVEALVTVDSPLTTFPQNKQNEPG